MLITKPRIYIRGMNRNTVIVDGTKPGSATCSHKRPPRSSDQAQERKRSASTGSMVWKASDVWVQNLTACNYLSGEGDGGNEIWWNGGDGTRQDRWQGMLGAYMTATRTFFGGEKTAAQYGIFSSNWSGGMWDHTYASNFNDSGYYIGACRQGCNDREPRSGQFNALGYSGSNSGGRLIVENSEFDHNKDGFDTNSQNGDDPAPQNGACPAGVKPGHGRTRSCWVFTNNSSTTTTTRTSRARARPPRGPVGTGDVVSGGRNDT